METLIAAFLGIVASHVQGRWLKTMPMDEVTRIRVRYGIAVFASVLCGYAINYTRFVVDGEFDFDALLENIGVAFASSQTYYNTYFRVK